MNEKLKKLFLKGSNFLGSKFPIMGGAMTWVSESNLVSATCNAGGFGVIAAGSMNQSQLHREILNTKSKTSKPFGVNLILMHPKIEDLIDVCLELKVELVVLAGGFPKKRQVQRLKAAGVKSMCFATTVSIAKKMIDYGIEALILEGNEAGGHIGPVSINVLVQEILPNFKDTLIFVAGGIGRGEIFLKYLELGAAGCQIGTRLVCSKESVAHEKFKEAFIKSEARNCQVSVRLDNRFPVIPVRAIENKASKKFLEEQKKIILMLDKKMISLREAQLKIEHFWAGSLKKAVMDGDIESGSLMAGQSVSLVNKIQPVSEILHEIIMQAEEQLKTESKGI